MIKMKKSISLFLVLAIVFTVFKINLFSPSNVSADEFLETESVFSLEFTTPSALTGTVPAATLMPDSFTEYVADGTIPLHLKGDISDAGWSYSQNYVFKRISNELYVISIVKDPGSYEFKLSDDPVGWNGTVNAGESGNGIGNGGGNLTLSLSKPSKVNIYYNTVTGKGAAYIIDQDGSVNSPASCNFANAYYTPNDNVYVLAGTHQPGSGWNPSDENFKMTPSNNDPYKTVQTFEFDELATGTYSMKATDGSDWIGVNGNNLEIALTGKSKVTVKLDKATKNLSAVITPITDTLEYLNSNPDLTAIPIGTTQITLNFSESMTLADSVTNLKDHIQFKKGNDTQSYLTASLSPDKRSIIIAFNTDTFHTNSTEYTLEMPADILVGDGTTTKNKTISLTLKTQKALTVDTFYSANIPGSLNWTVRGSLDGSWGYYSRNSLSVLDSGFYGISYIKDAGSYEFKLSDGDSWGTQFGAGDNSSNYDNISLTLNKRSKVNIYFKDSNVPNDRKMYVYVEGEDGKFNADAATIPSDSKILWYTPDYTKDITLTEGTLKTYLQGADTKDAVRFVDYNLDDKFYSLTRLLPAGSYTATAGEYGIVSVNLQKQALTTLYIDFNETTPTLKYKFNLKEPKFTAIVESDFIKQGKTMQASSSFVDEFGSEATPTVNWSLKTPVSGVSISSTGLISVASDVAAGTSFTVVANVNYTNGAAPVYNKEYSSEKTITVADTLTEFKINYLRYDGNYKDWNLWVWKDGQGGASHAFSSVVNGWNKATVSFTEELNAINFIIRKGEWAGKDGETRRFDLSKGTEVWLVQDDDGVYYSLQEAIAPRLVFAVMDTASQVRFKVSGNPSGVNFSNFSVYQDGVKLNGSASAGTGFGEGVISLGSSINPTALLEVRHNSGSYAPKTIILRNVLNNYYYPGNDLGYTQMGATSSFKVWAPTAKKVSVALYNTAGNYDAKGLVTNHSSPDTLLDMTRDSSTGVWSATSTSNLSGKYYMYKVEFADGKVNYAVDPYARAVSANGQRTAIVDLVSTNPSNWKPNEKPQNVTTDTDHILYELHIRDFSIDPTASFANKGKYLAFTETGLTYGGQKIGIDHLRELGITTVHLLPTYDFKTVNELRVDDPNSTDPKMNWGYDPQNYNVPEGSYSTDPTNPSKRITEFKQMVQALHDAGIRVVMDVVYNHTFEIEEGPFNKIVPGYYYRTIDSNLNFANGSGCGNEVATEREMVRKYILDSVKYWAREYNIDGFRFDLYGLIDELTASQIASQLKSEVDPSIIIYGEPWQAGGSPLENGVGKGSQKNQGYAVFNDNIRGAIKGDSDSTGKGFATGATGKEDDIVKGIFGATGDFTNSPTESINYVTAHDNLNLYDKVIVSQGLNDSLNMLWHKMQDGAMIDGSSVDAAVSNATPYSHITQTDALDNSIVRRANLTTAMIMTMQGVPFFQAGDEFLRTKFGDHNSYKSPDSINMIRWKNVADFQAVNDYYRGLIQLRKEHPAFRIDDKSKLGSVQILKQQGNVVAFMIKDYANGDSWRNIVVIYNGNDGSTNFTLPTNQDGQPWNIVVHDKLAGTQKLGTQISGGASINVSGLSAMVLYDIDRGAYVQEPTTITLDKDNITLEPGKTANIKVTVKDQFGALILNPTIESVSSNSTVATFENGKVTAHDKGKAQITIKSGTLESAKATLTVNVLNLSVSISPSAANSRQNPVITVTSSDITIKSITANLSAVGGSQSFPVSKESGKAAFGIRDYISAGAKTIPVTVVDSNNNTYYLTTEVTVTETPETGFDWDEARIYFMLTDRFYDGNQANNGALVDKSNPGAYHGGDFAGVTAKLDYLKGLGINTIWITPIVDNVQEDFGTQQNGSYYSYHGYWANDFTRLNPYLGTRAELETLIDEAADRGIKIMVDVVLNHAGYGTENNPNFQGMFRDSSGNDDETASLAGLPDFKTEDQAVRSQLINWQAAWASLKTAKGNSIAYFRLDTAKHVDHETLRQFKAVLASVNAEHKIIAEIWADDSKINTYLNNGEMDSSLDFSFKSIAKDFLNGKLEDAEKSLEARNSSLSNVATRGQFLSSHDENGFLYALENDQDKMKLAATLQITAKGQPVIYYGEEIGMSGANSWPQYDNRKDFDWAQATSSNNFFTHYSKLLNIRSDYSKLFSKGSRAKLEGSDSEKFMVFARAYKNQVAIIATNLDNQAISKTINTSSLAALPEGFSITDLFNSTKYTVNANSEITLSIPSLQDGGTAILVFNIPQQPDDGDNGDNGDNDGDNGNTQPNPTPQPPNTSDNNTGLGSNNSGSNNDTNNNTASKNPAGSIAVGEIIVANKQASITVSITPVSAGKGAKATLTSETITTLIKALLSEKTDVSDRSIEFNITPVKNVSKVDLIIPKDSIKDMVDNKVTVKIVTPFATISLDEIALKAVDAQAEKDIEISTSVVDLNSLPRQTQNTVKGKPVYEFTITSGDKIISDFREGKATVTIPYSPQKFERPESIVIYYLDETGHIKLVNYCSYNTQSGRMHFTINHFSKYALGYSYKSFVDVNPNDWFESNVTFVTARSLFSGVGESKFAPEGSMTRAMFAAVLSRLDDTDLSAYKTTSFSDVDIESWYGKAVSWASDKGIVAGTGEGKFDPDKAISREEMAVMLYRYMGYKGISLNAQNDNSSFTDDGSISPWAKTAVYEMKRYGIINGMGENLFMPKETSNRAQVSTVFAKFIDHFVKK